MQTPGSASPVLFHEVRQLIEQAREQVARTANSALTVLYWQVGDRIRRELLGETRAEYGEQIVSTLSTQLVQAYGPSFGVRSLRRMVQFSEVFPDAQIVAALSHTLSWSHFIEILPLKAPLERAFYAEMCRVERWSVRTLRERIASQLYLRWLDQHDRAEGEASPIGLILCASADREQVELMDLESANIRVAQYLHALPDVELLQTQLHRVVQLARERQARLGHQSLHSS